MNVSASRYTVPRFFLGGKYDKEYDKKYEFCSCLFVYSDMKALFYFVF